MALKAGRVGVSPTEIDEQGKLVNQGLTPEQSAKLDKALVTPNTAPESKVLVGINTSNAQAAISLGTGLKFNENTLEVDKVLVNPAEAPASKVLVGINTSNEQVAIGLGTGLSFDGNTLNAAGGMPGTVLFEREPTEMPDSTIVISAAQWAEYDAFDLYVAPVVNSKTRCIMHILKTSVSGSFQTYAMEYTSDKKIIMGHSTLSYNETKGWVFASTNSRGGFEITLSGNTMTCAEISGSDAYAKRGLVTKVIGYKNT